MIYTTYFGKLRTLPPEIVQISIAGKAPDSWTGLEYKKLAPKYKFFQEWKLTHDDQYYINCYWDQVLNHLDVYTTYHELRGLAQSDDFAIVCYEKPEDFCHRHIVAEWFKREGLQVEEWGV